MIFDTDDLVTSRREGRIDFIGMVTSKSDILTERKLGFLKRYHDSKSIYTVKGWDSEGVEKHRIFFGEQLEPAFKLDFDKMILDLTKKRIEIDGVIEKLETLQERALEARRNRQ